jgi:DNA-binding LacI/PurR family transcriptional regulator
METYLEFTRERLGLECPEYLQADMNTLEGGYRAMQRLLSLSNPPTAVFAVDDQMAIGAIRAASDRAYQVPRDVSVIGFDDIEVAAYVTPSLTTIHQPIEEIGRKAVELVLQKVADNSIFDTAQQILMEPRLIIRQSCAPPSR